MTEFTTPTQKMEFHEINYEKGILNIGSHPENDIVVQDPNVMPFHLMIDFRQSPYLVVSLNPDADIKVDGVPLTDNETAEVMDISQVSFSGYSMNLIQKNGGNGGAKLSIISPNFNEETIPTPANFSPAVASAAAITNTPKIKQPLHTNIDFVPTSDVILVEIHELKQTINVEQTAIFPLTIINGGSIVASFDIQVDGVPQEWVKITPERVNLNEGGRGRVEIQITPPRNPESEAGDYPVLIKVASSNYPGQVGGDRVELTINPYYEFAVGNLNPRYKSVSFSKNSTIAHYPIINQGNSVTNYLVMAQDDENGCKFEFQTRDDVFLVKQAELSVRPGEEIDVPVRIMPVKRNLVRLRPRQYQYNVTTQSMNEGAASRIVSGTFVSRPLFGIFSILMAIILLLLSAFFILRPRIIDFNVVEDVIALGDPAILNWKVSPFTTNIRIEGANQEISGSQNQIEVVPDDTAETYTLVAGNWLSRMLRMEDVRSKPITVLAIPPAPEISTFFVDKTRIFEGDDITIKWSIANADEAYLTVDGIRTSLTPQEMNASTPNSADGVLASLVPQEFNNERTVTLRNDSLIVLEAKNDSGSQFQSEFIHAQKPTIVIEEFSLSDTTIIKGEPVTIIWKVSGIGVENVMIAPFEEVYPLEGELTFFPEASMEFVLTVKNRDLEQIRLLPIGVLEPGAEPQPPTVEFFKVAPEEIVGSGAVEFSWSVSGVQDRIEISSIDGVVLADLPAQGFKSFTVNNTTSYVLTAYNGDLSSAAILEVTVNPTKKNAIITINKIVPDTVITRGDSVMVYYSVHAADASGEIVDPVALGWPELSGSVVVTDGFDTCSPVDLPVQACELTLNTSEKNKQITATYSGDENYIRKTSDPYPVGLDVVGKTAVFDASLMKVEPSAIVVGETAKISFVVSPEDPSSNFVVAGVVRVQDTEDNILCSVALTSVADKPMSGQGECLLTFTEAKIVSFKLVYEGNDIYDGKISSGLTLGVNQANTIISLISNWATPTVVGQTMPIEISVVPEFPGKGIPTGTFVIRDKDQPENFCEGKLNSVGKGQCNLFFSTVGNRFIEAEYQGDDNFRSKVYIHADPHPVNKAATSTVITSLDPATTTVGQRVNVAYQVYVTSPGSGNLQEVNAVTIDAGNNNTCVGSIDSTGIGSCQILLTKQGIQTITATYAGNDFFYGSKGVEDSYSVSIAATSTVLTSHLPNPSAVNELVTVSFSVSLSQTSTIKPNGPARVVANTNEKCETDVINGVGSCVLMFNTEGTRNIQVFYDGTSDFDSSISPTVSHTVLRESITSITATPLNPIVYQPVKIEFSVTGSGGIPSGSVTVKANSGESCSGGLTSGNGTCSITFTKSGTKLLTATYNGDDQYKSSLSPEISILVAEANTKTEISSILPIDKKVGESITVPVKVTSTILGTPIPSGNVRIIVGAETDSKCAFELDPTSGSGSCSFILDKSGGPWIVKAVYEGSPDVFNSSFDDTQSLTVEKAPTTISIESTEPVDVKVNKTVNFNVKVIANTNASFKPIGQFGISLDGASPGSYLCTGVLNEDSIGTCSYDGFTSTGIKNLVAEYLGADDYAASTSTKEINVGEVLDSTIDISISPQTSYPNQEITISVTVIPETGSDKVPKGKVEFTVSNLDRVIGCNTGNNSVNLDNAGKATCKITPPLAGDWRITVDYSGDNNYNENSKTVIRPVNQLTSTTSVSVTPSPSLVDQIVTVNVVVVRGGSEPGSADFLGVADVTATHTDGVTVLTCNDIAINASGEGSCTLELAKAGNWSINAKYEGNVNFTGSNDTKLHTVNKVPTITTVTHLPTTSYVGQEVEIDVQVERMGDELGDTPTGTVIVSAQLDNTLNPTQINCSTITLDSNGEGTCNLTFLKVGTWKIKAIYQTNTTFSTSNSEVNHTVIIASTSTTITLPDAAVVGETFTVSAEVKAVSPGGGIPTGNVEITAEKGGSETKWTVSLNTGGIASRSISLPSAGEWDISAKYSGDSNYQTSTGTSSITIGQASTSTTITLPDEAFVGETFSVEVKVTATSPGGGIPTGSVSVSATKISATEQTCTISSLTNGAGSCSFSLPSEGEWTITPKYNNDTNYKTSTGSTSITINKSATTTTLTMPSTAEVNKNFAVSVSVTANSPGTGTPTGQVVVRATDGTVDIQKCTITLGSNGTGSCPNPGISLTTSGTWTITATYNGSDAFISSSKSGSIVITASP